MSDGPVVPPHERAHRSGRVRWPDVTLDGAEFARYLAGVPGLGDTVERGADLFLVCACLRGDRRAIRHLEQLLVLARPAVARLRPDDLFIDEVLQDLRTKLLVSEPPALASYAGRGPLHAWLRVAATRLAIDTLRAASAPLPVPEVTEDMMAVHPGPELAGFLAEQRAHFQAVLRSVLAELDVRARNLLRRHLVDGLTLEEIAAPYGVHPATIARQLASLRRTIARQVRRRLGGGGRPLDRQQLESLFDAIRSQAYVSVSPLLSGDPAASAGGG